MTQPDRRAFVTAGGLALAGVALGPWWRRLGRLAPRVVEVRMRSDAQGGQVWFDPAGVHLAPGDTVRWIVEANVHTTTAYHPRNSRHALRIPAGAEPWDSGYLVNPGDHFDLTVTLPGVYDYFCLPHEGVGMVGRIVVGDGGAGAAPFHSTHRDWLPVPEAARKAFPSVADIMRQGTVSGGQRQRSSAARPPAG